MDTISLQAFQFFLSNLLFGETFSSWGVILNEIFRAFESNWAINGNTWSVYIRFTQNALNTLSSDFSEQLILASTYRIRVNISVGLSESEVLKKV